MRGMRGEVFLSGDSAASADDVVVGETRRPLGGLQFDLRPLVVAA